MLSRCFLEPSFPVGMPDQVLMCPVTRQGDGEVSFCGAIEMSGFLHLKCACASGDTLIAFAAARVADKRSGQHEHGCCHHRSIGSWPSHVLEGDQYHAVAEPL